VGYSKWGACARRVRLLMNGHSATAGRNALKSMLPSDRANRVMYQPLWCSEAFVEMSEW